MVVNTISSGIIVTRIL